MEAVIALLPIILQNLPGAISTTEQLVSIGTQFYTSLHGTAPTADQIAQLEDAIDADVALALTPLPPE